MAYFQLRLLPIIARDLDRQLLYGDVSGFPTPIKEHIVNHKNNISPMITSLESVAPIEAHCDFKLRIVSELFIINTGIYCISDYPHNKTFPRPNRNTRQLSNLL